MKPLPAILAAAALAGTAALALAQAPAPHHGGMAMPNTAQGAMPMPGSAPAASPMTAAPMTAAPMTAAPMGGMDMPGMMKMMEGMMAKPGDAASTRDFKAADMAMMHGMAVPPYTGDADVDLRTHMISHHEGAIAMSKVALKHAKSPETKAMAQKIIDDQEREITEMRDWLKKNAR